MNETKTLLNKAPKYRFTVFLLLLLPYLLVYAGIQIVSSVGGGIMSALSIGESKLSLLASLGSLAKALLAVVSGALVGRIGGKKVVVGGLAIMALSGLLYLIGARNYAVLCIVRLIQGAGSGLVSGCLTALLGAWFPRHERGMAQGAMSSFFGGAVPIATVYAYMCERAGMTWNSTVGVMLLGIGGVMAFAVAFFYKDVKSVYGVPFIDDVLPSQTHTAEGIRSARENAPKTWSELLRFPGFWITGIMEFFYCAACFGVGFLMPLFIGVCGFEGAEAARIMTIGTVGSLFTSFAGGLMSDKLFASRRSEMVTIAYGGAAVFFVLIAVLGRGMSSAILTTVYFASYGTMMLAASPAWVIPVEIVSPDFAAQCLGACITLSGIGGFAATYALGAITESGNIDRGMYLLAICMIIVALCGDLMKRLYKA